MKFEVKAFTKNDDISEIIIDALTEADATQQVKLKGLIPLSVKKHSDKGLGLKPGKGKFQLVLFSHELLLLLKAGLSLVESMETLREKEQNATIRVVLDGLMDALYQGLPLSSALEKQPEVFDSLYVAMVRSSEKTGDLADALRRFIDYQLQVNIVRKKIVSASIYPVLLLMVGGMVIMFLLLYVVPKFSVIYEGRGTNLPLLSQWLLSWGRLLAEHSTEAIFTLVFTLGLVVYSFTRHSVRMYIFNKITSHPSLKEKVRVYQLARFYRTAGMLLKGGIPIMSVLEMVSGLLKFDLAQQLEQAKSEIKDGLPMSVAMEKYQLTTPVAVRMMRVGERSGQMGHMLENIGDFYDDEIARWVDWFIRLFEPVLMTLIGLIVGLVVVLMYMPIFDLAGSIQ
jgi:general secretion pathway protein F